MRRRPQLPTARPAGDRGRRPGARRAWPARIARRTWPTCAGCRSRTAASTRSSRFTRSSTFPIPSASSRRCTGAGARRDGDLRHARTASRSACRTRSSTPITTSSSTPTSCGTCAGRLRARRGARDRRQRALPELIAKQQRRLESLLRRDPARLRRLVPRWARQRLYDRMLTRERRDPDPLAGAITPEDFELVADGLECDARPGGYLPGSATAAGLRSPPSPGAAGEGPERNRRISGSSRR